MRLSDCICVQSRSGVQPGAGSSLLEKSTKGELVAVVAVGGLNLGGSVDSLPNAVAEVEAAVAKQAAVVLMPISAR